MMYPLLFGTSFGTSLILYKEVCVNEDSLIVFTSLQLPDIPPQFVMFTFVITLF